MAGRAAVGRLDDQRTKLGVMALTRQMELAQHLLPHTDWYFRPAGS
jgi:hypothetical protein